MRHVRRPSRALLAVAIVVATWVSGGVAHGQPGAVRLALLAQTPWSTLYKNPNVQITVVVTNTSPETLRDLSLELDIGPSYISRVEYETSLTEGPSETIASITTPLPKVRIGPGELRTFAVRADLSSIEAIDQTDSRVYPARVELRSGGAVLASLVTPILYFVRPPEGTMLLSTWLELDGPIAFGADGKLALPSFEAALGPGGEFGAPVDALTSLQERSPDGLPIDLVAEPALVEQAQRMAKGYQRSDGTEVAEGTGGAAAAAGFLATLRTLMGQRAVETISSPFAGPSIPAMISSGLAANLTPQFAAGDATLRSVADVTLSGEVARPPTGALSDQALQWLADRGSRVILADADAVDRPIQPLDFAPPPTASVTTPNGADVSLVLPDPGVEGILARPDLLTDPVRASQALLGELAVIWKEEPVPSAPDVRGIGVALPSSLPPTIWSSLFERLDAPFLVPVHAADLVENVEPAGAPATLRSPSTESFPFSYAQSIRDLGRKVDAYASMLTQESPVPRPSSATSSTRIGRVRGRSGRRPAVAGRRLRRDAERVRQRRAAGQQDVHVHLGRGRRSRSSWATRGRVRRHSSTSYSITFCSSRRFARLRRPCLRLPILMSFCV